MEQWGSVVLQIGALAALALFLLFRKVRARHRYFEDRGVPYHKPTFLLGNLWRSTLGLEHMTNTLVRLYNSFPGSSVVGIFQGLTPAYVVKDLELVNRVLVKEFSHFTDRGFKVDDKTNPLDGHLFLLNGEKWRVLRNLLSPTFTSGKLKWMYAQMEVCGNMLLQMVDKEMARGDVEVRDLLGRFTSDVIGSCAFGLEPESLKDPDSAFCVYGKRALRPNFYQILVRLIMLALPNLAMRLKIRTLPKDVKDFFTNIIRKTMDHRRNTGFVRNDFVQLLLQLKDKGYVDVDPRDSHEVVDDFQESLGNEKIELTDEVLTAQAYIFFVAGFETTATTMTWALYLLAKHPEAQEKARKEIREVKKKHGGFTYDAIKELHYLENCINEALRMYPPVPLHFRECTKSVSMGDLRIEKGSLVFIPTYAIHMDPEIYPEPQEYRPERFQEGQGSQPGTFTPFGGGPRICIGKRFAMIEVKMAMAMLLDCYEVKTSPKTREPIKLYHRTFLLRPEGGLWLRLEKLQGEKQQEKLQEKLQDP